ncbi:MAG: hypothetical protein U0350_12915 [Caldilineaceae bacterium]
MTTKNTTTPNAQSVEAMPQDVLASTVPNQPVVETPAGLPANSQHLSTSQRKQAVTGGKGSVSACCAATVQQSCCEPVAKAACCGAPATPGSCGCQ